MRLTLAAALLLLSLPSAAPAVSRWVDVDGLRVHYLQAGSGAETGPVLLMVHGWTGGADNFQHVMGLLPAGMRALAVDLPGCGQSDKRDVAYDLPFFVGFLRSFCAALDLDRFILVGHSMGGQFAVHFTARWPDLVQKLILIAPDGMKGEEGALLALARSGGLVDFGFSLNNRLFIEWALRANVLYRPAPETVRFMVDSVARGTLGPEASRAIARITRNVIGHDPVEELLPAIGQDALVIWGDRDRVLAPKWAERFAAALPRAALAIVADAGHMPMIDKPQETAKLIADFAGP